MPLQFKQRACAITQAVISTNWRAYGLSQSRGSLPSGPVTVMVHMASVWVPFTSESKEAIAAYPEIQKELRLGLQAVGRKLGMYLRRRQRVKQEGERRNIFLRYLGEVAAAVSDINGADRDKLYARIARGRPKRKPPKPTRGSTTAAERIEETEDEEFGENVLIVRPEPEDPGQPCRRQPEPQKKLF